MKNTVSDFKRLAVNNLRQETKTSNTRQTFASIHVSLNLIA